MPEDQHHTHRGALDVRVQRSGLVALKEMAPQMLVECVRKVAAGEQWIERRSLTRDLDRMLRREAGLREVSSVLTPREIEIVRLVAEGLRNQAIGERLHISEGTVKVHLHNIYEKLGIDGRVTLTHHAREKGLPLTFRALPAPVSDPARRSRSLYLRDIEDPTFPGIPPAPAIP